jgi:hypothetical protein
MMAERSPIPGWKQASAGAIPLSYLHAFQETPLRTEATKGREQEKRAGKVPKLLLAGDDQGKRN